MSWNVCLFVAIAMAKAHRTFVNSDGTRDALTHLLHPIENKDHTVGSIKKQSEAHETLSVLFARGGVPNVMIMDGAK